MRCAILVAGLAVLVTACGESDQGASVAATSPAVPHALIVTPGNSSLLVGVDRISVALFDEHQRPVTGARTTIEIKGGQGGSETRPLADVAPEYGGIPVYVGTARFRDAGQYQYVVRAVLPDGRSIIGATNVTATTTAMEQPVGAHVPALKQPIATDPGVKISDIDSGVPPDPWHTATIADGLAQHRPMVLYFGEPGFCKSRTCGPTVQVLQQLDKQYGSRMLFEHIEDHFPAGPDETSKDNPVFDAFGLRTDPWVYFVNSGGVISDRFEGPVTLDELREAAEGTLAGRVPAVDVSAG